MSFDWKNTTAPMSEMPEGNLALRLLLDDLAVTRDQHERDNLWEKIDRHHHLIREISNDSDWEYLFNCHAYALGIANHPDYLALATAPEFLHSPIVGEEIFDDAHKMGLIDLRQPGHCKANDLLTYFDEGGHTHTAIVVEPDKLLKSKWSTDKIYEHGMLEVPACYGSPSRIYSPPKKLDEIIKLLKKE